MQSTAPTNRLIEELPHKERKRLLDGCKTVDMDFGEILYSPNLTLSSVWFPLTGIIARLAAVNDHPPMKISLAGREGMLGETLVIDIDTAPYRAVVQGSGTALQVPATDFVALIADCPALKRSVQRYLFVITTQVSRVTPCIRFHMIEARLAYCLLMIDDRTCADHFDLTHQNLSEMLGVQRSAVTLAARALQANGLISYSRGRIHVVSRTGLRAISCECYAESVRDYTRQFPV